jgi:hypothetical protein
MSAALSNPSETSIADDVKDTSVLVSKDTILSPNLVAYMRRKNVSLVAAINELAVIGANRVAALAKYSDEKRSTAPPREPRAPRAPKAPKATPARQTRAELSKSLKEDDDEPSEARETTNETPADDVATSGVRETEPTPEPTTALTPAPAPEPAKPNGKSNGKAADKPAEAKKNGAKKSAEAKPETKPETKKGAAKAKPPSKKEWVVIYNPNKQTFVAEGAKSEKEAIEMAVANGVAAKKIIQAAYVDN